MELRDLRLSEMLSVGIADLAFTNDPTQSMITYALGSCAGVSLYDPKVGVGGLIHCMLPMSSNDPAKAKTQPAMYVDTGLILLLQKMFDLGADRKNLICKVAGCGNPADAQGLFKVGERNYMVVKKILWKNSIVIKGERVGGTDPKTMIVDMKTGKTFIKADGGLVEL